MAKYEVILKRSAVNDMDSLRKYDAAAIADMMEKHLARAPGRESKSRIKRLRGIENPDYRLRIGEYRIFYNIEESQSRVIVLRVMHKDQTQEYYKELEK